MKQVSELLTKPFPMEAPRVIELGRYDKACIRCGKYSFFCSAGLNLMKHASLGHRYDFWTSNGWVPHSVQVSQNEKLYPLGKPKSPSCTSRSHQRGSGLCAIALLCILHECTGTIYRWPVTTVCTCTLVYFCKVGTSVSIRMFLFLYCSSFLFQNVTITGGCSGALELAICSMAGSGENILIASPGFSLYKCIAEAMGIECRCYELKVSIVGAVSMHPPLCP